MFFNTNLMEMVCHELRRKNMADIDFVEVMQLFDVGDPLCTRFGVTFVDNKTHKNFRGIIDCQVIQSVDLNAIGDCVYQLYLDYKMKEGPDQRFEPQLKYFYDNFEALGDNYFAPVKIFFKALRLLSKYKNIELVPEEFRAEQTICKIDPWSLADPLQQLQSPAYTEYFFKTRDMSYGLYPSTEFSFRESDFDQFIHEDDPETIKPLMAKADGLALATARVLGIMSRQYHP